MKKRNKWAVPLIALALTGLCFGGVLATGDQNDPLITLSYLEQTVLPNLIGQMEEKATASQKELTEKFDKQLADYKAQLGQSEGGGADATYTVVTLTKDQKLQLGVGCEVMLRVGSATVTAATSPALVDVATGGSINGGAPLEKNHLYMATIADRSVTATADSVKILVRGSYTVA